MAKTDKPEKNTNNKDKRHFWKDFKAELKKVIWPTRSQVINNTIVVLVIVLIVAALCFVLDLAFEALNTYGIDNLKTVVQSSISRDNENTINENTIEDGNTTNTTNVETNEIVNADEGNNVENQTANDTAENN